MCACVHACVQSFNTGSCVRYRQPLLFVIAVKWVLFIKAVCYPQTCLFPKWWRHVMSGMQWSISDVGADILMAELRTSRLFYCKTHRCFRHNIHQWLLCISHHTVIDSWQLTFCTILWTTTSRNSDFTVPMCRRPQKWLLDAVAETSMGFIGGCYLCQSY